MNPYRPDPVLDDDAAASCLYETVDRYCARGRCAVCDERRREDGRAASALACLVAFVFAVFAAGFLAGVLAALAGRP